MRVTFLTKEIVNLFIPNHQTTSCSDEKADGEYLDKKFVRCPRCYFLNVLKWEYHNPAYQISITIEER